MYFGPPPKIIDTELFSTVPTTFRNATSRFKKGKLRIFLEGPSFDRQGNLYCIDSRFSRIFRISPKGEWDVPLEYDGHPNSLKVHKDGTIYIADRIHGIMHFDPSKGDVTKVIGGPFKQRFMGINDLVFARNGDLYFTDQGQTGLHDPTGRVYRYTTAGKLQCLISNGPSPNGLVFNVRETSLLVAMTRSNQVWRIPLDDERPVAKVGLFVQLFSAGPDGLAVDQDNNVVVTHPGMGIVWLFSKRGVPLYQINSCRGELTTNIVYGGDDMKTLYIVDSLEGNILMARMPVAGKPMYSHM